MSLENPDLSAVREAYADDVATAAALTTRGLREAFATVPREHFLRPAPWLIVGEGDPRASAAPTQVEDPRRLYANVSVAIDPARQLFNGAPVCTSRG